MSDDAKDFCVGCGDVSSTKDGLCLYHHVGGCHTAETLRAKVQAYENGITWQTECLGCADLMNKLYEADQVVNAELRAECDELRAARDAALRIAGRAATTNGEVMAERDEANRRREKAEASLDAERDAKVAALAETRELRAERDDWKDAYGRLAEAAYDEYAKVELNALEAPECSHTDRDMTNRCFDCGKQFTVVPR